MSRVEGMTISRQPVPHATGGDGYMLDSRGFRVASMMILALDVVAAIYLAVSGQWYDAAALGGLAAVGSAFLAWHARLPSIFSLLFVLAGLINAAGYVFNLWKSPPWFDETVHAFTSFTVMAAIGWMLLARSSLNAAWKRGRFTLAIAGLGLAVGVLWEVFEWIIGIIGSPVDTGVDLVMDTFGAVAAGLFCAWAAKRERRRIGHPWSAANGGCSAQTVNQTRSLT